MLDLLIIDDNPDDLEWMSEIVKRCDGINSKCFDNGDDAIEHFRTFGADGVLIDHWLRGSSGLAVHANLKAIAPNLPVLYLSGIGNDALAADAMKVGATSYLSKAELTVENLDTHLVTSARTYNEARLALWNGLPDKTVLLVEDNIDDRQGIQRLIEISDKSFRVFSFATGEEAVAHFCKYGARCVLLDHHLETENGLDVMKDFAKVSPFVPVIMLTGQGNEKIAAESISAGASDYLIKNKINQHSIRTSISLAMERAFLRETVSRSTKSQDMFLHALAEDLRVPMNLVQWTNELILKRARKEMNGETVDLLNIQKDVTECAVSIIDDLESYADLGNEAEIANFSLSSAVDVAKLVLTRGGATADFEILCDPLPSISGARARFAQFFQSLISDIVSRNDTERPKVYISCEDEDDLSWTVVIRDNGGSGTGGPSDASIIKDVQDVSSDRSLGSSLALASCVRIARLHDARFWSEKTDAGGIAFYLNLSKLGA